MVTTVVLRDDSGTLKPGSKVADISAELDRCSYTHLAAVNAHLASYEATDHSAFACVLKPVPSGRGHFEFLVWIASEGNYESFIAKFANLAHVFDRLLPASYLQ